MEATFWKKRWEDNHIGFHRQEVNPQLEKLWDRLDISRNDSVLVPLCGKSIDLLWLAQRHTQVDGVELSEIAVNSFFKENQLNVQHIDGQDFDCYQSSNIQIFLGDFFQAPKLKRLYSAGYDNLGLCALSESYRERYAMVLGDMILPSGKVLMNVVEHQPESVDEPPFSISELVMRHLFETDFKVTVVDRVHHADGHPEVKDGKLSYFDDVAYILTRRTSTGA